MYDETDNMRKFQVILRENGKRKKIDVWTDWTDSIEKIKSLTEKNYGGKVLAITYIPQQKI